MIHNNGDREKAQHAEIAEKARLTAEKIAREKLEESERESKMNLGNQDSAEAKEE